MFAVITTEEYQELLQAKNENEFIKEELSCTEAKLLKTKNSLQEFVFLITKGEIRSKWSEGLFEGFDLVKDSEIAEYINTNFMKDGKLIFSKENNNE